MRDGGHVAIVALVGVLTAVQEAFEGSPEFDGHGVVEDGIDGAVHVDHDAAKQEEPHVEEAFRSERVVDHVDSVGHPQDGEHPDDDGQHLDDLSTEERVNIFRG